MPGAEADHSGAPRLRRARRADIPALLENVGGPASSHLRNLRRLLKTLVADVYVLAGAGGLLGVVAVTYRRSLAHGGLVATIDLLRVRASADSEADRLSAATLVRCAVDRATRRGCVAVDSAIAEVAVADALEHAGLTRVAAHRLLPLRNPPAATTPGVDAAHSRGEA
jgi:hypothetical protein